MAERRHERAQDELFFRGLNERIRRLHRTWGDGDTVDVVCECGDVRCFRTVTMATADYDRVREADRLFVVRPGHEAPELERVVEQAEGYVVVEKAKDVAPTL